MDRSFKSPGHDACSSALGKEPEIKGRQTNRGPSRRLAAMRKTAVHAGVRNIYYTTRQAFARAFDYRRLWSVPGERGQAAYAYAWAAGYGDPQQHKLQKALRRSFPVFLALVGPGLAAGPREAC